MVPVKSALQFSMYTNVVISRATLVYMQLLIFVCPLLFRTFGNSAYCGSLIENQNSENGMLWYGSTDEWILYSRIGDHCHFRFASDMQFLGNREIKVRLSIKCITSQTFDYLIIPIVPKALHLHELQQIKEVHKTLGLQFMNRSQMLSQIR